MLNNFLFLGLFYVPMTSDTMPAHYENCLKIVYKIIFWAKNIGNHVLFVILD